MLTAKEQAELNQLHSEFQGLTPDEMNEMEAIEKSFEGTSFLDRVGATYERTGAKSQELQGLKDQGEIGTPQYLYRMGGEVAVPNLVAPLGAAIGEGAEAVSNIDKSLGGYGASAVDAIGQTGVMQAVGRGANAVGGYISELSKEYPEQAGIANATLNYGSLFPAAGLGKSALKDLGKSVKSMGKKDFAKISPDDLREMGSQAFQKADELGGGVKPEFWQDYIKSASLDLKSQTDEPWLKELAEAGGESKALEKAVAALQNVDGDPKSFSSIKRADEILGDLAESNVNNMGKYNAEGRDFLTLQMTLRNKIADADKDMFFGEGKDAFSAADEARKLWSAQYRLNDIEQIMLKAKDARQPATQIKNGFRRLRSNPKKFKNYTPEEQFYIEKAASTGTVEGLFNLAGSGAVPIVAGAAGSVTAGPIGAGAMIPAYMMQQGAKKIGTDMAQSAGERAGQAVVSTATGQQIPDLLGGLSRAGGKSAAILSPAATIEATKQESLMDRARRLFQGENN